MVQPEFFWMATHLLFKMIKVFSCENINYVCALKSNDSPLICMIDYYFTHLSVTFFPTNCDICAPQRPCGSRYPVM